MTAPQRSSGYDWSQSPQPTGIVRWVADHRVLTRFFLAVGDAALVVVLVTGLIEGDNRWYSYVQLLVWAWLTINFGWLMPRSVDAWRRRRDQPPA